MKRIICLLVLFVFIAGCNQKTHYQMEDPFFIVTSSPVGPDDYRNFFLRKLTIDGDGELLLQAELDSDLKVDKDAPVYEAQLEIEQVNQLKNLIEGNNFWKLKEDLTNPDTMDGDYLYITVNQTDQSKKVGGLNPDNPRFTEIIDYVFDLVTREKYNSWEEDIKEFIYKINLE